VRTLIGLASVCRLPPLALKFSLCRFDKVERESAELVVRRASVVSIHSHLSG